MDVIGLAVIVRAVFTSSLLLRRSVARVPFAAVGAIVAVLSLCGSADAAKYKGTVENAGTVSFRLAGQTVKRFQASMTMSCVSAAPSRSDTEIYVVASPGATVVSRKGRFSFKLDLPKQQFTDETGKVTETLYSVKASVEGKVSGKSAKGTVKVTYNKYWTAYDPFTGFYVLTIASCTSGPTKVPWSASSTVRTAVAREAAPTRGFRLP